MGICGEAVTIYRNDDVSTQSILNSKPKAIVISPGPCHPDNAGICIELIKESHGTIPILGVCLGYQAIAVAYGGSVPLAPFPVHGKVKKIQHRGGVLFKNLPEILEVTRYHSLCVDEKTLPDCFDVTAVSHEEEDRGLLMAISHKTHPVHGVQFHPESIRTTHGMTMIRNFLESVG